MPPLQLAVLASGRGSNLQAIIDGIEKDRLPACINIVISDCADAFALKRAQDHGIPWAYLDPRQYGNRQDYDRTLAKVVEESRADLVVLAGFMRVLSTCFLERFPHRVINIHPALLPSFPGMHGQKQALAYGVKISGCTVHFVDHGVDTGPIIAQRAVPVRDDDTEESLSLRILEQEHQLYTEVIGWIAQDRVEVVGRRVNIKEALIGKEGLDREKESHYQRIR
ncbi:phosphoribosylglycinamide formyltransferase [Candidatus Formimonas warabiya]|uniref:Phosphoribosylglycinamide formyltransferase n=1 Tax=Formimonas warabiya TaxID=1761012 RepID=A0A3G1KMP2_FORW1|nr:phosphoribosylglycinamide formyltransferase [Candidatus Formimonas warabiya]ATW23395.1 phosphoribosylglycinamide formyltransferase [Candidatus Formimonas warabiya]